MFISKSLIDSKLLIIFDRTIKSAENHNKMYLKNACVRLFGEQNYPSTGQGV